jgi:FMN reductase
VSQFQAISTNTRNTMSDILLISGSPTARSRSGALLEYAAERLGADGLSTELLSVRDYPAEDLILAKFDSPAFELTKRLVAEARGLIVATPVYKAAYTGSLKALLDILPQQALRNKTVLPVATGGTPAHLLVLDYALKPVLGALGASDILQGVFVTDDQIQLGKQNDLFVDDEVRARFDRELDSLAAKVKAPALV